MRLPASKRYRLIQWGTAMRVVNAIPVVCEARCGVLSILDLPHFTARAAKKH